MGDEELPDAGNAGTKPGAPMKARKRTNSRLVGILTVMWCVLAITWLSFTVWTFFQGDRDYIRLVFGILYLGVAVGYVVMWRGTKSLPRDGAGAPGIRAGESKPRP
jgi:hypothetical protein